MKTITAVLAVLFTSVALAQAPVVRDDSGRITTLPTPKGAVEFAFPEGAITKIPNRMKLPGAEWTDLPGEADTFVQRLHSQYHTYGKPRAKVDCWGSLLVNEKADCAMIGAGFGVLGVSYGDSTFTAIPVDTPSWQGTIIEINQPIDYANEARILELEAAARRQVCLNQCNDSFAAATLLCAITAPLWAAWAPEYGATCTGVAFAGSLYCQWKMCGP